MTVTAIIIDGPLTPQAEAAALAGANSAPAGAGATLRFEGIVRPTEPRADGTPSPLLALDYKTYDPMAQRELESLAAATAARHKLTSIKVLHSRGRVAVGGVSFILEVAAPHRAETLAAVADFIDRLKQDVPIWKSPIWPN
jgi:molybdopterin synthase catalytic subunit